MDWLPSEDVWMQWVISAGVFAFFLLLAIASKFILNLLLRLFAKNSKTVFAKLLLKALTVPIFIVLIIIGLWIALARLPEISDDVETANTVGNIFFAVLTFTLSVTVVRVINAFIAWYNAQVAQRATATFNERFIPIMGRVVDVAVYAVALILILDRFEVEISPLLAGLGIGGVAIALALQPTLGNFLSGTYVITDSIIQKGHYILLDSGYEGVVEDIGWRTTKIRHWQGNLIVLPNNKLADSIVVDYERPESPMIFLVYCGVSYDSDLANVERVTLEVANKMQQTNPLAVNDFIPVVRFKEFGDSNINFAVLLKGIDRMSQFALKTEFIKNLHARYKEEGIEIQYPARKLYFADDASLKVDK